MEKTNKRSQEKRKINKQWTKDEITILIEMFEARPDLWDPSRSNYSNRYGHKPFRICFGKLFFSRLISIVHILFTAYSRVHKQNIVEEIATRLKVTVSEITSKFHSLRSQFNRECSKEKKQKSGSASSEAYISKWEYMSSLQFLKAKTVAGETVSSLVRFVFVLFIQSNKFKRI